MVHMAYTSYLQAIYTYYQLDLHSNLPQLILPHQQNLQLPSAEGCLVSLRLHFLLRLGLPDRRSAKQGQVGPRRKGHQNNVLYVDFLHSRKEFYEGVSISEESTTSLQTSWCFLFAAPVTSQSNSSHCVTPSHNFQRPSTTQRPHKISARSYGRHASIFTGFAQLRSSVISNIM